MDYEEESFSAVTKFEHLNSQIGSWKGRPDAHHHIVMETSHHRALRVKAILPTLGPPALHITMALSPNICGSALSAWIFKDSIPGIHYKISFGKKYVIKMTHSPCNLDNENKERVRKNTT